MGNFAKIWNQVEESLQTQRHSIRNYSQNSTKAIITLRMAKHKAESLGNLLAEFFRGTEAETTLLERKIPTLWVEVLGKSVVPFTGEMEVKNGVLYVHIHSAALRQQLFEQRYTIVNKLNEASNAKVLTDIRLLG